MNVTVLTVTAGLFLVLALNVAATSDRFSVCDLRLFEVNRYAETYLIEGSSSISLAIP